MPDEPAQKPEPVNAQAVPNQRPPIRIPKIFIEGTQKILKEIEDSLSHRILCYYMSRRNSINQGHPDIFLEQLRQMGPQEKISLILVSDGGDSSASLRIATIVREYCKSLEVIIPSRCASAATVLALSADKITMCPSGYLTAIDSSLVHPLNPKGPDNLPTAISVDQIKRILKFLNEEGPAVTDNQKEGSYRTLFKYVNPVVIGEIDRLSSRTIMIATKMMKMHPLSFENEEKINWIAQHLYNDYPEHGFPITYQEAKEIGLPVEKADMKLTDALRSLVNLYDSYTTSAVTHFSEIFNHQEYFTVTVESVGLRTSFHGSYDRRLNSVTRRWQNENDASRWVNIIPPQGAGQKATLVPLGYRPLEVTPNNEESSPAQAPTPIPTPPPLA